MIIFNVTLMLHIVYVFLNLPCSLDIIFPEVGNFKRIITMLCGLLMYVFHWKWGVVKYLNVTVKLKHILDIPFHNYFSCCLTWQIVLRQYFCMRQNGERRLNFLIHYIALEDIVLIFTQRILNFKNLSKLTNT